MFLKIDSREKNRISLATNWCRSNKIEYEVKELKNSDYILCDEDKTVGFEYKRIDDFIQSVKDGRIFRQIQEMDNTFNFVFISGFKDYENYLYRFNNITNQKIYKNDLIGAISRLNTMCDAVLVQWNYDVLEDLLFMKKQAEKCFNTNVHYGALTDKKKTENAALNYLASIKGVSYKKASAICEKYNVNSLIDLLGLTESSLKEVNGIGDNTAKKIRKSIGE